MIKRRVKVKKKSPVTTHQPTAVDLDSIVPLTVGQQFRVWFDPNFANQSCCGLGIINTGGDDPFFKCCVIHDEEYLAHHAGTSIKTLDEVNTQFYECIFKIANSQPWFWQRMVLRERARIYRDLVEILSPRIWNRTP